MSLKFQAKNRFEKVIHTSWNLLSTVSIHFGLNGFHENILLDLL